MFEDSIRGHHNEQKEKHICEVQPNVAEKTDQLNLTSSNIINKSKHNYAEKMKRSSVTDGLYTPKK